MEVMVAQHCACTKMPLNFTLKMVNFMLCKFHFNNSNKRSSEFTEVMESLFNMIAIEQQDIQLKFRKKKKNLDIYLMPSQKSIQNES